MSESLYALVRRRPAVLLLEPEPMLRLTMTKFLRRSGYFVTACADGEAAELALIHGSLPVSLIVMGVRDLDRAAAETAWRLRDAAPEVPVLGIADVPHQDAPDGPALPDNVRFLAHPFDMPDVLRAVRSSLRQSGFGSAVRDRA